MKTSEQLIELLRERTYGVGAQARFARETGISRTWINLCLNGKSTPGRKVASALGYEPRVVFVKREER